MLHSFGRLLPPSPEICRLSHTTWMLQLITFGRCGCKFHQSDCNTKAWTIYGFIIKQNSVIHSYLRGIPHPIAHPTPKEMCLEWLPPTPLTAPTLSPAITAPTIFTRRVKKIFTSIKMSRLYQMTLPQKLQVRSRFCSKWIECQRSNVN